METRRVLVTGSSRGIGKQIALKLAKDGFRVTVHCQNNISAAQDVVHTISRFSKGCYLLQFDVSNRDEVKAILEQDIKRTGPYYGVVCNAGITKDNAFPSISSEDWDQVIHTNLDGFYNVMQPIIMPMIQARNGGRIIGMSSVSGIIGNRGQVNYSASKAGLIGAIKSLAVEMAKRKITVNCIAPGLIETEMLDPDVIKRALQTIPMNRMGSAEEVAGLAGYLFSDNAAYITRQVISVNGGML